MRLKEPFIKYKGPRARMVYAPQREALPALYSPKPWGHREWVDSSASLKMLSLTMASKEEKSAFYYCLILVSLVCKFSVVSLNWTRRSLWIDLLLWKTELEASLKSGSLGPSQPPQLTSGKTTLVASLTEDRPGHLLFPEAHGGGSAQGSRVVRPCSRCTYFRQIQRHQRKPWHEGQGQDKVLGRLTSTAERWFSCSSTDLCRLVKKLQRDLLWILNFGEGTSHWSKLTCIPSAAVFS